MTVDTNDQAGRRTNVSEYRKHTKKYTEILGNYVTYTKSSNDMKARYKKIFFWAIMGILFALAAVFLYSVHSAFEVMKALPDTKDNIPMENIIGAAAAVISSSVTVLAGVLKLPKIIAEYLFNPEEDKGMAQVIGQIQKNDTHMYSIESKLERQMMADGGSSIDINSVNASSEYPGNPDENAGESA